MLELSISQTKTLLIVLIGTIYGAHCALGAYISTDVANAVCTSLSRYKSTSELVNRIENEMAERPFPFGWIRWTKCDNTGKPCSRFSSKTKRQGKPNHNPSGTQTQDLNQERQFRPKTKIIITFKAEQNCSAKEIPHERISKPNLAAHSMDITSTMIALQQHAQNTQKQVIDLLEKEYGITSGSHSIYENIESLWITNEIVLSRASLEDVQKTLEGNADILSVREEHIFPLDGPSALHVQPRTMNYDNIIERHWGVKEINAPEVWAAGYNGTGVVIGIIDGGVDASHEALVDNYRKDYGWFDGLEASETYRWTSNHGMHVTGTAVGRRGIGVAPGAQFIACLACHSTACTESGMKKCAQWMYCPTDPKGKNPDCSKRPHVINMSSGVRQSRNLTELQKTLSGLIDCWTLAGIFPVFATGNDGPYCRTVAFPGILNTVIGVGNVGRIRPGHSDPGIPVEGHSFQANYLTSQGPAFPPYNATVKPDLSAPGTSIVSCVPGGYDFQTGTSMASPHVAGTIALMIQKNPALSFDEIKSILTTTTIPTAKVSHANFECGGIPETTFPNHNVGHGVVNAYKAVSKVRPQLICKHKNS